MRNPTRAAPPFTLSSPGIRSAYLGLLGMIVIGLLSWLHYTQHLAVQGASRQLAELRQARIELTQGFLQVSLADKAESPFSRANGLALLQQSIKTFERALVSLDLGDGDEAEEFRHSVEEFRHSVEAFRARLTDWRDTAAPEGRTLVALRIAFANLERRAGRLDNLGHRHIEALGAYSNRVYAWSLAGSLLALGLFLGIVLYSANREQKAFAEQVRLNQARSDSEARFARLFHDAPLPLSLVARNGVLRARNRRFDETFGYSHDELRSLDDWWSLAYPDPAYRAWVLETWNAAMAEAARQGTDIAPIEYKVTCKGGCERVMLISGITLGDDFLATFFDITERKQTEQMQATALAEQKAARLAALNQMEDANAARRETEHTAAALRENQERLQLLIDHAPASLAMFDRDMRYLAVSRRWLADFGLGDRDLLGHSHYEIFPEIPERWREAHRRGLAGEVIRADEDHFDRADGSVQWLRWEVRSWQAADGGIGGIVIFAEDITARIQTAHALRDSEARLRATVDTALDCIIAVDADGHVVEFNPAAERTFGFSKDAMVGQELAPRIIPERYRADHVLGLDRLRAGRDGANMLGRRIEVSALRADGSEFPAELAIEMARLEAGQLYVAYLRDISERLRARQEILDLNANLERRVVERTAELSAANQELDAFAYAVSHDLRAPLRAMNGFAQALEEDYAGQLQGEAKSYLDQIGIASRRMGDLIEGILTLSRSTRGELRRDAVDLSALARRRLEERARDEPGRRVAVTVEDGLMIRGDARMLEAALGNLIDNAWKYSAKADAPTIRLRAEDRDGRRWFCVEDNGAGFDMAHAARLFQPFQRLHRQDEFPGIGIGLATVARIVHRHGGEIEARGEVDQGATFCFTLADAGQEDQACAGS